MDMSPARMLDLCRTLPRTYPICITAGDLLELLASLAAFGAREPKEANQTQQSEQPVTIWMPAEECEPAGPLPPTIHLRLPRGEPKRRIDAFLGRCNEPQTITAIGRATGLDNTTVSNVLERGGYQRDPIASKTWRLRTTQPIPLSPPERS